MLLLRGTCTPPLHLSVHLLTSSCLNGIPGHFRNSSWASIKKTKNNLFYPCFLANCRCFDLWKQSVNHCNFDNVSDILWSQLKREIFFSVKWLIFFLMKSIFLLMKINSLIIAILCYKTPECSGRVPWNPLHHHFRHKSSELPESGHPDTWQHQLGRWQHPFTA